MCVVISSIDGLASKGISRVEEVDHGHVVEVDARHHSHMPELVRMTPSIKKTRELLLWETVSVEQQTRDVGQSRLEEWCDEAECVGESFGVGCVAQWDDTRACHANKDEDAEVPEAWQIKEWVQRQDAANNAHTKREGHEDPLFGIAKEPIVQSSHDRGCDQDADPDVVECGCTAHHRQARMAEKGVVESGADEAF